MASVAIGFLACSCGPVTPERRPVPPPGSDEMSSMPWNVPQPGEGQGALGGMMEQR